MPQQNRPEAICCRHAAPEGHTGSQHAAGHIDITSVARGRWVVAGANYPGAQSDPTAAQ